MKKAERERFDHLFDQVFEALPPEVRARFEVTPVVVEDHPSDDLLLDLGMDPKDKSSLCGLHTGVALTERSVDDGGDPEDVINIFREGIIETAGGWEPWTSDDGEKFGGDGAVTEQIRITLLHELGHHFGLDEDDLAELGYE
jgi:predicted Zn-dependent protease with MMP-like domain